MRDFIHWGSLSTESRAQPYGLSSQSACSWNSLLLPLQNCIHKQDITFIQGLRIQILLHMLVWVHWVICLAPQISEKCFLISLVCSFHWCSKSHSLTLLITHYFSVIFAEGFDTWICIYSKVLLHSVVHKEFEHLKKNLTKTWITTVLSTKDKIKVALIILAVESHSKFKKHVD